MSSLELEEKIEVVEAEVGEWSQLEKGAKVYARKGKVLFLADVGKVRSEKTAELERLYAVAGISQPQQ